MTTSAYVVHRVSRNSRYYMPPDAEFNHGPCKIIKPADPEKLKKLQEQPNRRVSKFTRNEQAQIFKGERINVEKKYSKEELEIMKGFVE